MLLVNNHRLFLMTIGLFLGQFNSLALGSDDDEGKLEIHNTFKPEPCERKAKRTDILTLHYKGTLPNGEVFDSTYERDEPFSFQLGIGQVIRGWEEGLEGICAGEKRRLVVPPSYGYGRVPHDKIPAGSTLHFEVHCLKVEDGPNPVNVYKMIDLDGDGRLSRDEVKEFLVKQLTHSQPGRDASELGDTNAMLEEVFNHEDKNNDGYISRDEFSGPKHDHDEL